MTEGDRVILRRYPVTGRGTIRRQGFNDRWLVVFDDPRQVTRWCHRDELMSETAYDVIEDARL